MFRGPAAAVRGRGGAAGTRNMLSKHTHHWYIKRGLDRTGDIDCVYHFALYELQETVKTLGMVDAADLLAVMVDGKRLKDISDLPLDLAV